MKRVLFLTGTRADFGKLKSLIEILLNDDDFLVDIFATGMHMDKAYGYTVNEIIKCGYPNIYKFINFNQESSMDIVLSKTVEGFSDYVKQSAPDLIIVHGDRVEALAGAIVASLNNILLAHIEGGEVSGTIDELIRHSVSKLSHTHFVSNDEAKKRLIQMGELSQNVFVIGSPDVDLMFSDRLPALDDVLGNYEIPFKDYGIIIFHPVTTELEHLKAYAEDIVRAVKDSGLPWIGVYPNNDLGTHHILETFLEGFKDSDQVRFFPSLRFEYFLVLLKNAKVLLGNSSAGVREAPYYGVPSIDVGSRQNNRTKADSIISTDYSYDQIFQAIKTALKNGKVETTYSFGVGGSDKAFYKLLKTPDFWEISKQKFFNDLPSTSDAPESD